MINLPYSAWSSFAATHAVCHRVNIDGNYDVWSGHNDIFLESIATGSDKTDFETNHLPSSTAVSGREEAEYVCRSLAASVPTPKGLNGAAVVQASAYEHSDEDGGFDGYAYTCPANTISIFDEPVTKVLYVQGAICWWDTPAPNDYGEFAVVDKDDVLGLFSTYGLTVGVDVLEVAKYVRKFRPPPWREMVEIKLGVAGKIVPGLYMRFIYNNDDPGNVVKVGVNYIDYSGP